jgi:hypothetical protein
VLWEFARGVVFGWRAETLQRREEYQQLLCRGGMFSAVQRTGKTTGIPPRTGLLPSSLAAELRKRFSRPLLFQLITVAPYRSTSTESPVGRLATTFPCSEWTLGCGPVPEGEMAEGLFGRSIVEVLWLCWWKKDGINRIDNSKLKAGDDFNMENLGLSFYFETSMFQDALEREGGAVDAFLKRRQTVDCPAVT